jgi:hypothetical protein
MNIPEQTEVKAPIDERYLLLCVNAKETDAVLPSRVACLEWLAAPCPLTVTWSSISSA